MVLSKFLYVFKYIRSCSSGETQAVVPSGSAPWEDGETIPILGHMFIRRNKPLNRAAVL